MGALAVCARCRGAGFPHDTLGTFPHCGHLICGFTAKAGRRKPHLGGTPDDCCELCYAAAAAEAAERTSLQGGSSPPDAAFNFLERAVTAVSPGTPGLKPDVIVAKVAALWEVAPANPRCGDLAEEMARRTTQDVAFNAFLEKMVPVVSKENPTLKPKVIVDKAIALWAVDPENPKP